MERKKREERKNFLFKAVMDRNNSIPSAITDFFPLNTFQCHRIALDGCLLPSIASFRRCKSKISHIWCDSDARFRFSRAGRRSNPQRNGRERVGERHSVGCRLHKVIEMLETRRRRFPILRSGIFNSPFISYAKRCHSENIKSVHLGSLFTVCSRQTVCGNKNCAEKKVTGNDEKLPRNSIRLEIRSTSASRSEEQTETAQERTER